MASVKDPPHDEGGAQDAEQATKPSLPPAATTIITSGTLSDTASGGGEARTESRNDAADAAEKTNNTAAKRIPDQAQEATTGGSVSVPALVHPPPPRTSSHPAVSPTRNSSSSERAPNATRLAEDAEDEWQEMPVVRTITEENESYVALDEEDRKRYKYQLRERDIEALSPFSPMSAIPTPATARANKRRSGGAVGNATGRHLDVNDARGYDWRSKPAGIESDESEDEEQGRGYTQIQLEEDEEAEQLHAATEYLFADVIGVGGHSPAIDGPATTPAGQMKTTKQLLSEGQRIAYVGLCSLLAKDILQQISVAGNSTAKPDLAAVEQNTRQWLANAMAKLYIHMEIEESEQRMIDQLGEHGVLASDLAPNLATTHTIDNPDFDPEALRQREEREEEEKQERELEEKEREREEKERQREEKEREEAEQRPGAEAGEKQNSRDTSPADSGYGDKEHLEKAADEEDEDEDDEDDGDIGMQIKSPPIIESERKRSSSIPQRGTPQGAMGGHIKDQDRIAQSTNDEGDVGLDAPPLKAETKAAQVQANENNPRGTDKEGEEGQSPATRIAPLADPNSAAQVLADNLRAEEAQPTDAQKVVSKTLGLTSEPQSVQPPPNALDGVTTEISTADKTITLDIRWTVLCDLFLLLTSEGNYDARSRVLLEKVAIALGLTWLDVTKFEKRVTDTLELEEGAQRLKDQSLVDQREKESRNRRYVMMGLATVGGGLVIGLSAGLLAPLIGAGLGAALGTIGIGGTSTFLGGIGGAALITTTGTLGGAGIAGKGMSKRTRSVKIFEFKAIHNQKRFNCIIAITGFMSGPQDDPRLPFSVLDSMMGDLFSVLWEPDMMQEMGNAIGILWNETLTSGVQQVLAATIAGGLVGALAWPLWLSKLGYLIDNPWSNALDRAKAAGLILADVLAKKQMGARPITLVGFSLGARVIYYALMELHRQKAFGLVQNVYLIGAPVSPSRKNWLQARAMVAGRFANAYSSSDWILGYLHRATAGGLSSVAGLHPIENVPDVDNVDVTHLVPGHLAYRALMPLVLSELGFRTTADYFDEPEDLSKLPEREVVLEPTHFAEENMSAKSKFSFFRRKTDGTQTPTTPSMTPSQSQNGAKKTSSDQHRYSYEYDEDADVRTATEPSVVQSEKRKAQESAGGPKEVAPSNATVAINATANPASLERNRDEGTAVIFDTDQILAELRASGIQVKELETSLPPLSTMTVDTSVASIKPTAAVKNGDVAPRPALPSREASESTLAGHASYLSSGYNSGYNTPPTMLKADGIRDRTLSKPLPPIDPELSAAWAQPSTQPIDGSASAWAPAEVSFAHAPDGALATENPYSNPAGNISLTFASYDDDEDISIQDTSSRTFAPKDTGPPQAHNVPPSRAQLSFAAPDGSITFSDENPWS